MFLYERERQREEWKPEGRGDTGDEGLGGAFNGKQRRRGASGRGGNRDEPARPRKTVAQPSTLAVQVEREAVKCFLNFYLVFFIFFFVLWMYFSFVFVSVVFLGGGGWGSSCSEPRRGVLTLRS